MARNLATTNTARYTVICKSYDTHSRPSRAAAVLAAPDLGQVVGHEVEVGASALRNQAGWEGGVVGYKLAPGLSGARECGSIFAREYSKLRADGPHANGLKVGDPILYPAEILSRRRR